MANTVRFIHAADVHLGTPFRQAGVTDSELGEALSGATYAAFDQVLGHAVREGVDFVVLSGDTFDSAALNLPAQSFLANRLTSLLAEGIGVYMVNGNHDPASGMSSGVPLPPEVCVFAADHVQRIDVEARGGGTCSIYGRSFFRSDERSNLALGFRRDSDVVNAIAVLHANVGGSPLSDPYSPCTVADLAAAGMDYWALGHIHLESVVSVSSPLAIYPGSTQALTINETGRHGCYLVELTDGTPSARWLPTGAVDVTHVPVDLTGCDSLLAVPPRVVEALNESLCNVTTPTLVRIVLTGRRSFTAPVDDTTRAQLVQATQDVLSARSPRIWVDSSVMNRSRLDRIDDVGNSANPFIRAMVELADAIDVSELMASSKRLGKADGRTTAVTSANALLLDELDAEREDLIIQAKEYAVSMLLGEGE